MPVLVMLVEGIHVVKRFGWAKDVGGRDEPGKDD
jgi:hypothetical protein